MREELEQAIRSYNLDSNQESFDRVYHLLNRYKQLPTIETDDISIFIEKSAGVFDLLWHLQNGDFQSKGEAVGYLIDIGNEHVVPYLISAYEDNLISKTRIIDAAAYYYDDNLIDIILDILSEEDNKFTLLYAPAILHIIVDFGIVRAIPYMKKLSQTLQNPFFSSRELEARSRILRYRADDALENMMNLKESY